MKVRVPIGYLRHVMLMKFKPGVDRAQVAALEAEFRAMTENITAVQGYEWGRDESVERKAQGFTHCFLVTFKDEAGRDAFLTNPDYMAFADKLEPMLDNQLVFDYRATV